MNQFITHQIDNIVVTLSTFTTGCELAAKQDDGKIDKKEVKLLKRINKVTENYVKELNKIKNSK